MLYDLVNECLSVNGLYPQVLTQSAQGSSQDFANAEVSCNAIIEVGAYGANSTNLVVQIEESADGSTNWAVISGMVATVTTSNTHTVVRGLRTQRYVRANANTVTGTTPSIACSVSIVSQKKFSGTGGGYSNSPAV